MNRKAKNHKKASPKKVVRKKRIVEDEKDRAIREMGEASRALASRTVVNPESGVTCCQPFQPQMPTPVIEEKTGDPDTDKVLNMINTAISAGPAPVTLSVTSRVSGKPGYYWQYWEGEEQSMGVSGSVFAITPKAYFDENGCLDDSHFEGETDDIPKAFSNLMESMFEFAGTREEAEAILKANPLFEEKDILHVEDESEEE